MRSKTIKSAVAVLIVSAFAFMGTACSTPAPSAEPTAGESAPKTCTTQTPISIGGGAVGGVYYTVTVALKKLIDEKLPCLKATVSAGTSQEAMRANLDVVMSVTDGLYSAANGNGKQGFQAGEKYAYKTMALGYDNSSLFLATSNFAGSKIADLKPSDTVAFSSASQIEQATEIMKLHKVNPKVIVIDNYNQLFAALRQGQINVAALLLNHPATPILEASQGIEFKPLTYTESTLAKYQKTFPDYSVTTVKAKTYPFITKDYKTWSRPLVVAVKSSLPKSIAEDITALFYEETAEFVKSAPPAKDFTIARLQSAVDQGSLTVAFHPGSKAYFESKGVKFPAAK